MLKRNIKWIIYLIFFILLISGFEERSSVREMPIFNPNYMSPIVMVPGSSAGENRFDYLISNLPREKNHFKHSVLKVEVNENDKMRFQGGISRIDNQPIIVVSFQNNRDGYQNINQQAKLLGKVMQSLQNKYGFTDFRALGHSNGGLIWTLAIEKYINISKIHLDCLMTIATPYNLHGSKMLNELVHNRNKIPYNTTVYSIAGAKNYSTDGLVKSNSVYSGKYIYQSRVRYFTEITVTGENTSHSDLPENRQVIGIISNYLFNNLAGTKTFQ
ncbi:alpha/beta hydrolase [Companilactobacillus kimchiensis]|nr:alpha/beta hydrolase [Companilactobacillus kimchiensis]